MKTFLLAPLILILNHALAQQINWSTETIISSSINGNLHPRIVVDASGDPLIVWGNEMSNECKFSRWNGTMFSSPITINTPSFPVFATSWAGPDIASKGDTVYIVMKQTPEDSNPIYIKRSFDGGQTYSSPIQVDFIAPDISRFPTIAIDDSGNPIVAFMKFDAAFLNARWVVVKSSDFGNTFSTDVMASGWSGGDVCDCCPGTIISESNIVAMLYRDNLSNNRDSWTGISTDNGATFSSGYNVDLNNWMIMACPSTGPDGIIIGDSIYSVFMNGASGSPKVFLSSSTINGLQTTSVQPLSGNNNQNYPRISNSGSALGMVWKETILGDNKALLRFTADIISGLPSYYDTIAQTGVANADIAIYDGKLYIVWQDDATGTLKFKSGNFTPSTNIEYKTNSLIKIFPNPTNTDEIQLYTGNIAEEILQIRIEDIMGKLISNKIIMVSNGTALIRESLEPGIYILKLATSKGDVISRFIRQ